MKNLQLSLKTKWFEMTKAGIKTEDYRLFTPYWCNRLLLWYGISLSKKEWNERIFEGHASPDAIIKAYIEAGIVTFKAFTQNTMILGYPKKGDTERTLILGHKGIEIRTGNHEWGAEPGKMYFVIKHGNKLN